MSLETFRSPVPENLLFKGRPGDIRLGEWVKPALPSGKSKRERLVIWGCPDDTGVRLNRGRAGAKDGPDCIRKHLYKMTMPMDFDWENRIELYDAGNLVPGTDIRETHDRCRRMAASLVDSGSVLIVLGGGHDFAAPNFLGFADCQKKAKLGLINIDPHLDVRELENEMPHSGTPFRQILESGKLPGPAFTEFGARACRNTRSHYAYCRFRKVTVMPMEELRKEKSPISDLFRKELKRVAVKSTTMGTTFDMDACCDTEGISAAPVIGFSAREMCEMSELAGVEKKVRYFEIAEVAPSLDFGERSARIAAEMIYSFLRARALQAK